MTADRGSPEDQILDIVIEDGRVVMSIGVNCLLFALECELQSRLGGGFTITDRNEFIQAVVNELRYEEDDGSTSIHRAFDKAAIGAIENGCDGIQFED